MSAIQHATRSSNPRRHSLRGGLAALLCVLLVGCRSLTSSSSPDPLSISEVLALHQQGLADAEIIQRIAQSGAVYPLSSEDVLRLREAGVSPAVVDFMLNTRVEAAARSARRQERLRWLHPDPWGWYGAGYNLWYPAYPFWGPCGDVRVIRRSPSAKP